MSFQYSDLGILSEKKRWLVVCYVHCTIIVGLNVSYLACLKLLRLSLFMQDPLSTYHCPPLLKLLPWSHYFGLGPLPLTRQRRALVLPLQRVNFYLSPVCACVCAIFNHNVAFDGRPGLWTLKNNYMPEISYFDIVILLIMHSLLTLSLSEAHTDVKQPKLGVVFSARGTSNIWRTLSIQTDKNSSFLLYFIAQTDVSDTPNFTLCWSSSAENGIRRRLSPPPTDHSYLDQIHTVMDILQC